MKWAFLFKCEIQDAPGGFAAKAGGHVVLQFERDLHRLVPQMLAGLGRELGRH